MDDIDALLDDLFSGEPARFGDWIRARTVGWTHLFDIAAREAELEALAELTRGIARRKPEHFLESI